MVELECNTVHVSICEGYEARHTAPVTVKCPYEQLSALRCVVVDSYFRGVLFLARGIEDHHYWVVREVDGALMETPWRVEWEADGFRLSHADDSQKTDEVFALGAFLTAEDAVSALRDSGR